MAIDFVCGFECRIVTPGAAPTPDERHWDTSATGAAISTSTVRSGTAALRLNPAGANMNIQKTVARTVVAGRMYIRIASMPTSIAPIMRHTNANGHLNINVDTDGTIKAQVGAGADSANAATLVTGTWYLIDWLADSSSGTASLKLKVDGGTEVTATNTQASVNMTAVMVGQASSETYDIFYDDLILGTVAGDYPFGAGTVERMKPTRDGTHSFTANDFRYNAAGANIATSATDVNTYVDDDDLTSISDFIAQRVVRSTGYVEVGFGTAPFSHAAQAVAVVSSWHASTTGANTVGLKMNDGGTLQNMLDEGGDGLADYSQTSVVFSEKILTAPPSGGTWTKAKLDAVLLRMGYATDVIGEPFWDGAMLEVAYAPAPDANAPAGNAAGTGVGVNPAASVKPTGGEAAATGAAANSVPAVKPNAATATATGTANNATTLLASNASAGAATGTGTGVIAAASVKPNTGTASGTGAANNATTLLDSNASPSVATGTGTGANVAAKVAPNAGTGTGTGAANNATVSVVTATNAAAGVATGTGAASNASTSITVSSGTATGTGAASGAMGSDQASAIIATGTGEAYDATATTVAFKNADAETATGTADGLDASPSIKVNAGTATGTGEANNAFALIPGATMASAGVATGSGTAHNATISYGAVVVPPKRVLFPVRLPRKPPKVLVEAGLAVGSGRAYNASVHVLPNAGTARGTGEAHDATTIWNDDETALLILLQELELAA